MLNLSHIGGSFVDWGILASLLTIVMGGITVWIKGHPERGRVSIEARRVAAELASSIENKLRVDVNERFKEFRVEVHGLRNELHAVNGELRMAVKQSGRREDKLNMLLFILSMVMDELHAKEPENSTLAQAISLLKKVEDSPHQPGNSASMNKAEDAVDATNASLREVRASEAKNEGGGK